MTDAILVIRCTLGSVPPPTTLLLCQPTSTGPRGESHPPATQGDPIRAPKQPVIHPNQQSFSLLPNTWLVRGTLGSVSTPTTLSLSQPTSAELRGGTPFTCDPGGPHQSPQTTSDTTKSTTISAIAHTEHFSMSET